MKMIECGLYQGDESLLEQYRINSRKFNFKVKDYKRPNNAKSNI